MLNAERVCDWMEISTSASCKDGVSLIPSPRKPTTRPDDFNARMILCFCIGDTRAYIYSQTDPVDLPATPLLVALVNNYRRCISKNNIIHDIPTQDTKLNTFLKIDVVYKFLHLDAAKQSNPWIARNSPIVFTSDIMKFKTGRNSKKAQCGG